MEIEWDKRSEKGKKGNLWKLDFPISILSYFCCHFLFTNLFPHTQQCVSSYFGKSFWSQAKWALSCLQRSFCFVEITLILNCDINLMWTVSEKRDELKKKHIHTAYTNCHNLKSPISLLFEQEKSNKNPRILPHSLFHLFIFPTSSKQQKKRKTSVNNEQRSANWTTNRSDDDIINSDCVSMSTLFGTHAESKWKIPYNELMKRFIWFEKAAHSERGYSQRRWILKRVRAFLCTQSEPAQHNIIFKAWWRVWENENIRNRALLPFILNSRAHDSCYIAYLRFPSLFYERHKNSPSFRRHISVKFIKKMIFILVCSSSMSGGGEGAQMVFHHRRSADSHCSNCVARTYFSRFPQSPLCCYQQAQTSVKLIRIRLFRFEISTFFRLSLLHYQLTGFACLRFCRLKPDKARHKEENIH